MMIHAYPEMYLNNSQSVLGETFDCAVNRYSLDGDDFVKMFVASTVCKRMENGEQDYICGKSGSEIAGEVLYEITGKLMLCEPREMMMRTKEYWIGWAVAFYQWHSGRKYSEIFQALSFADLEKMYFTLHEADISKFAELADARVREAFPETNLKRIRTFYGCTQAELANASGVSLRSVQMYEQRNKDINKASADTIYNLSKVLGCTMEDLLEK